MGGFLLLFPLDSFCFRFSEAGMQVSARHLQTRGPLNETDFLFQTERASKSTSGPVCDLSPCFLPLRLRVGVQASRHHA